MFNFAIKEFQMAKNKSLHKAKSNPQDEFYTQLSDIEKELKHYRHHFKDKVVICNCDDPRVSNFTKFFILNFKKLGLKRLIATCYKSQDIDLFTDQECESAVYMDYYGTTEGTGIPKVEELNVKPLKGDGDFASKECLDLLEQADIVVTNPPFSKFRQYLELLVKSNKKFLIIGNQNDSTCKEVFSLIKDNKVWLGFHSGDMSFQVPASYPPKKVRYWQDETGQKWRSMGNICWYTNLDHNKRHEEIVLYRNYKPEEYPKYDQYDAIEVPKISEIPMDYEGIMGVPITFLSKFNPEQFELIGIDRYVEDNPKYGHRFTINGNEKFARILIRKKKPL